MIGRYIKYILASKSRYKIHSPFVFNLINKVLRKKTDISYLKSYTAYLKNENKTIDIQDFGAGSRKDHSNSRKVKAIFKTSSSSAKKADLIRRICEYERDQFVCLELGTNLGVAAKAIAASEKCKKLTTVEGCPNLFEFTMENLKEEPNIVMINSLFDEQLDFLLEQDQPHIVYIDGNHTYEATKRYYETISKFPSVDLIIFDDINWSSGMLRAWNEIIQEDKFKVSINLFRIGLLYRRTGQSKENFTIRY